MKNLSYDEVVAGIRPIVEENPDFIYPQQADEAAKITDGIKRCTCVEVEQEEDDGYPGEYYLYEECDWHMDDDNTCRYVSNDNAPACVVGHYFVKELGFDDLYNFETKSPLFVLEAKGYIVDARAQRFLNTIQSQQDQGWDWNTAFDQAIETANS